MATLLAAFVGGLLGGGIPAYVSYIAIRHRQAERRQIRQWEDAAVLADAYRLLVDIDPARRGLNVRPEEGVEDSRWAHIGRRLEDIRGQLIKLSAGHPSADVQSAAQRLDSELSRSATYSRNFVSGVLKSQNTPEQLRDAQECHEAAFATAKDLELAVKRAGRGARTPRRLGRRGQPLRGQ